MNKVALVVEFKIKPGKREDFLKLMREHAAGTRANVDGCLQFDVLVPKEMQFDAATHEPDTQRVFLYELYRDEDVLQKHLKSERVAKTRGAYAEFIESRKITRCSVG
jgi:quinol monooxygenase YgiN